MTERDVAHRFRAFVAGRPLPRGTTLSVPIGADEDVLVVAFVRMGGESAPWGIGWKRPGGRPELHVVPEARNREDVAALCARFGVALAGHLGDATGHRQVFVPGRSHVEMFDLLGHRYARARKANSAERLSQLRALAQCSTSLFVEARCLPGVTVVDCAQALAQSYAFPVEDVRQAHVGYLLALLQTKGTLAQRLAAGAIAEQESVSTSLAPALERDVLAPLLASTRAVDGVAPDATAVADACRRICAALTTELQRRLTLVERAIAVLRADGRPRNPGLDELVAGARIRQQRDREHPVHPTTDFNPATAASRYFERLALEESSRAALIHGDAELQADEVAVGDAIRGVITALRDEGSGRKRVPVWEVTWPADTPLRLREGEDVCVAGLPLRTGTLRRIEERGGRRVVEVEITGWTRRNTLADGTPVAAAIDACHVGSTVTLLPLSAADLTARQSKRVWKRGGPGSWLTHPPYEPPEAP